MRQRFEQEHQTILGLKQISDTEIPTKSRDAVPKLLATLKAIFINPIFNQKIFKILEEKLIKGKKYTGRKGMNLWQIFVLAQFRLGLNISYDRLHHMANYDSLLRQIMGVETEFGFKKIEIEYQNIIDNVSLVDDEMLIELNAVIVEFGHGAFKKKDMAALDLKTDSFVLESDVHFPTDYNLLWDCARKCLDTVSYFLEKYPSITGWRKISNWYKEMKNGMRALGQAKRSGGNGKEDRVKKEAEKYLVKAEVLKNKLIDSKANNIIKDTQDLANAVALDRFIELLNKHIDLVDRRLIKGETIPHEEKIFSIFEDYTEWINKGKLNPNVELGKKIAITTDQFHLIVDYRIMEHQADSEIVESISERLLALFKIHSWSFDKGFYHKNNKSLLEKEVEKVIMPKKGKYNNQEKEEERAKVFVKLRHKHSAIESNINELEHRGLDRCPDRGYEHFKRYVGLAVCAYNLHRIGKQLIKDMRQEEDNKKYKPRLSA